MWPIWWQLWHTTFLLTLGARLSPLLHQHTNTPPPLRALEGLVAGLAALVAHALTLLGVAGAIASLVAHHRSCSTSSGSPLPQRALPPHPFPPPLTVGAIASLVASLVANVALHLHHHFRQQASYLLLRMNKL